jgi:hypothetical protein
MLAEVFLSSDDMSSGEKLSAPSRPKLRKNVQRSDKTKLQKSSEVEKNCPTKRQNKTSKVVRSWEKLSNEATKPNFKSRPKLRKTVQRSDKTKLQKSSEVERNCPTKQQNQVLKVVRSWEKLSNEATKQNFKSRPKLGKTVRRSNKTKLQKSSEVEKNCPTK